MDGRGTTAPGALAGLRVVEFSQNAAVPQCGRLLAGMGADVVKVEPPEGDSMRLLAGLGPDEGRAYATINPGKRSTVLDMKSPRAPEVIDALVAWADVVLVGLKQRDVPRFGLDWDRVRSINPSVVELIFTPFGPDGPDAQEGGYDVLVQGLSGIGFMVNRSEDGVPQPTRPAMFDFASGMAAAAAVLAALRHRDTTGEGQRVDASLLGTAMNLGTPVLARFEPDHDKLEAIREEMALVQSAGADFDTQRRLYESRVIAAAGAFRLYFRHYLTADGLISVAGLSPALFAKFHRVTGLAPVSPASDPSDPEFVAVVDAAEALFACRTTDEWIETLRAVGYPCARYNTPISALDDPQVRANDYAVDLVHPTFGEYSTAGMPFTVGTSHTALSGPSPRLGEHTREVMAEIGLAADADTLAVDGVIAYWSDPA